jgi:predicted esterase
MSEPLIIFENNWIFRIRKPETDTHKVIFLVHGWTGDENSMWVFAPLFPKDAWLIAPRGVLQANPGGFGWVPTDLINPSKLDDFILPAQMFFDHSNQLMKSLKIFSPKVELAGFSQGAALVYSTLVLYPGWAAKAACMSGFLPKQFEYHPNFNKFSLGNILITHGNQDKTIPINEAFRAESILKTSGASVRLVSDSSGHKLGVNGSKAVKAFFG